VIRPN